MYHERSGGLGLVRASGVGAGVSVRTLWILFFLFHVGADYGVHVYV